MTEVSGVTERKPASGVELHDVHKAFGEVPAVHHLDLALPEDHITALVGPSGCGKTTTLRLVAGFEAPDRGEIWVGENLVAGEGRWMSPERRRVGIVFQQLALFPHLDVARNIAYGLRRWPRGDRRRRVDELLGLVGLSGYEHRRPHELSGGQAQRVALARALAPKPDVVLLDEPFSSLDVSLRAGVRREVRRILEAEGVTALLVTHDQDEALAMGDQVAVMLDGSVVQVGPPEDVYRKPGSTAVAAFLGDANLVDGTVSAGVLATEIGELELLSTTAVGPALGLVRPEDLDVRERGPGGSVATSGAPGEVVHVEYYGHDQLVVVALASGRHLRARLHARERFTVGASVHVSARTNGVVAFPA